MLQRKIVFIEVVFICWLVFDLFGVIVWLCLSWQNSISLGWVSSKQNTSKWTDAATDSGSAQVAGVKIGKVESCVVSAPSSRGLNFVSFFSRQNEDPDTGEPYQSSWKRYRPHLHFCDFIRENITNRADKLFCVCCRYTLISQVIGNIPKSSADVNKMENKVGVEMISILKWSVWLRSYRASLGADYVHKQLNTWNELPCVFRWWL